MFTLLYDGEEKTLAEWGLSAGRHEESSQDVDTVTLNLIVQEFDTDPIFPIHSQVTIYNQPDTDDAGTKYQFFYGWVTAIPLLQAAGSESQGYTISGPWYWFERLVYQQELYGPVDPTDPESATVIGHTSACVLNQGINGARLDTAQQIIDVLNYILDTVALDETDALPASDPPFQIPASEVTRDADKVALDVQLKLDIDALNAAQLAADQTGANRIAYLAQRRNYLETWQAAKVAMQSGGYPSINIQPSDGKDLTCAEVIRNQLRFAPDAAIHFDHSTTPPTLYIKRRTDMDAVTLQCGDDSSELKLAETRLTPLYEFQVPAVILKYEVVNQDNGANWKYQVWDVAPYGPGVPVGGIPPEDQGDVNDRVFGAIMATIPIAGYNRQVARGYVETRQVRLAGEYAAGTTEMREWILDKLPALRDASVDLDTVLWTPHVVTYPDGTTYDYFTGLDGDGNPGVEPYLDYELIRGTIAPWMPVTAENWSFNINVSYELEVPISTGGDDNVEVLAKPINIPVVMTNAETGWYSKLMSFQDGELIPSGLAAELYTALGTLQYAGDLKLHTAEINDDVHVGDVVNIEGGRAEWETMNAIVQRVSSDLDTGEKIITIGKTPWLSATDLTALLNMSRTRQTFIDPSSIVTGEYPGGTGEMPSHSPKSGSSPLDTVGETNVVKGNYAGEAFRGTVKLDQYGFHATQHQANGSIPVGSVSLDLRDTYGKHIAFREVDMVENVTLSGTTLNVQKAKRIVVVSPSY